MTNADKQLSDMERFMGLFGSKDKAKYLLADNPSLNQRLYLFYSDVQRNGVNWGLENLKRQVIHLQSPNAFNDPFDCRVCFDSSRLIADLPGQASGYEAYLRMELEDMGLDINAERFSKYRTGIFGVLKAMSDRLPDSLMKTVKRCFITALEESDDGVCIRFFLRESTLKDMSQLKEMTRNKTAAIVGGFEKEAFEQYWKDSAVFDGVSTEELHDIVSAYAELLGVKQGLSADRIQWRRALNKWKYGIAQMQNAIDDGLSMACLTEELRNPLMWAHYGHAHRGICLAYDFSMPSTVDDVDGVLLRSCLFRVRYGTDRVLAANDLTDAHGIYQRQSREELMRKLYLIISSKGKEWEYEREWRLVLPRGYKNEIHAKPVAVYLGARFHQGDLRKQTHGIINLASSMGIPVYQAKMKESVYGLNFWNVSEDKIYL